MSYTMNGEQHQESTKTASKELAINIIKQPESEIVLGLFKVVWEGDRMSLDQLSAEIERAHIAGLAENTVKDHRAYLRHLRAFFDESKLTRITVESVETRLSGVAADAVVQRAMRHTSPETKRRYQLGMTDQVRRAMEKSNKKAYCRKRVLRFMTFGPT
jgi:hypothetical protein